MIKDRLPQAIDPIRFVEQRQILEGSIELSLMKRLIDIYHPQEPLGKAWARIEGGTDSEKRHYLRGRVEAELLLVCQRCLKPLSFHVVSEFSLSPVITEKEAKNLPGDYDPLYFDGQKVSLTDIIEDEILLALPDVPKHEYCESALKQSLKKNSPFAKLAELKRKQ